MKTRLSNQAGFEVVGVIVAVLLVAVVALAGYKVVSMNKSADSVAQSTNTGQVAAPDKIRNKADLAKTEKALVSSDSQLDSSLDDKALDADVDSML